MPQVPVVGAPSVQPNASPTPFVRVQAPPSFGQSLGQGLADIGQQAQHTSEELQQHAVQYQQLQNQLASSKAGQAATSALDDYRNQYTQTYFRADAQANLSDAYKKIDELVDKGGQGLPLPAQTEYLNQLRRQAALTKGALTEYATQQHRVDVTETAHSGNMQAVEQYARDGNDADFGAALGRNASLMTSAGLIGNKPEEVHQELLKYTSLAYGNRVQSLYDSGDLTGATNFYAAHRGDMLPEAQTHIENTLRTATQANYVDGLARSTVYGGAVPGRPAAVPSGSWDTGLSTFRADPVAALARYGIPGATVTGGARDAVHNAAVGGSPTSEHLTNSAWDFVPPRGMTMQQAGDALADHLHAAGIPYDQIEVADNHVHVGFGAKNRNETIDGNGKVTGQSPGNFAPIPLSASTDPNQFLATALQRGEAFADAHITNPVDRTRYLSSVEREARIAVAQIDANQKASYDKLDNAVVSGNIQDVTALQKQFPSDWNNLRPQYKAQLERGTQYNARVITPERQNNIEALTGQAKLDPTAFLGQDIRGMDLPLGEQRRFLKMQDDLRSQQRVDKSLHDTMGTPQVRSALVGLGINAKESPDAYYQFAGAMQAQFEGYAAKHNGALPQGKDLDSIVSTIASRKGRDLFGNANGPAQFQVPDAAKSAIRDAYMKRNQGREPTDNEVGYWYQRGLNNGQ